VALLKGKRVLLISQDSAPFRAIACYGANLLAPICQSIDVLTHAAPDPRQDCFARLRKAGLLRTLDERLYCLVESWLTPWHSATEVVSLDSELRVSYKVSSLRDSRFRELVVRNNYDAIVGVGCGYVPVIDLPATLVALNIHPGILPFYKGVGNPEACLRGDSGNVGVTVHHMTDRLDEGLIVYERRIAGLGKIDIPTAYLFAYKVGLQILAGVITATPPLSSSDTKHQSPAERGPLWRLTLSLFILGRLRSFIRGSFRVSPRFQVV
jgi:hypothetical protein